jgi:hypothetical protein
MPQTSIDTRFGRLKMRHGIKQIGTLRSRYGPRFARGCADGETRNDALHKLDEQTLTNSCP